MSTLYLTEQYATVRKDGDCLVVHTPDKRRVPIPLLKVEQVVVVGDVTLTGGTVSALLAANVEVCFVTRWGRYQGRLSPVCSKNGLLRQAQHAAHQDAARRLDLARRFVAGKLANQRTLLLRQNRKREDPALAEAAARIQAAARRAAAAPDLGALLGEEGSAGQAYFGVFGRLLSAPWQFGQRVRRPPTDPVNALLSLGYSLLANDVASAVQVVGLDPYAGYLHAPHYGRPALVLDLMEEFRAVIADSVVLTVLNNRMLTPDAFVEELGTYRLGDARRRDYLEAYEARLNTEVQHPVFGYRASYRRCLELQARLLAKTLLAEIPAYPPFAVR